MALISDGLLAGIGWKLNFGRGAPEKSTALMKTDSVFLGEAWGQEHGLSETLLLML